MPDDIIKIPFDFEGTGQDKLLQDIVNLEEGLKKLSERISELPYNEAISQQDRFKKSLSDIERQIMLVNQSNKEAAQTLISLLLDTDKYRQSIDGLIKTKLDLNKTEIEFKAQLDANSRIIKTVVGDIEKLSAGTYEGKRTLEELNEILVATREKYTELSKQMQVQQELQEREAGYYGGLKILLNETQTALDGLSEEEAKNIEIGGVLNKQIQDLTLILSKYKVETTGATEAQTLLARATEKLVAIGNTDVETKAKQVIATRELEIAVDKQVASMTGGLTKEEISFNKAWLAGEEWQKNQTLTFNKAWLAGEEWQKKNELIFNKAWRDAEVWQMKQTLAFNKAWIAGEMWQSKQAEIAIKAEEAANKSTLSWDNFVNIFERMGLRMIASLIWWTAIIGAVTALYEWWTKVDDATQLAIDRLKDYNDGIKSLIKDLANSRSAISSNIEFDISKANSQISIMQDHNKTLDQRFEAYKKIMSIAPNILDELDKHNFSLNENSSRMKEQIEHMKEYIKLQDTINENRGEQKKIIDSKNSNLAQQSVLSEKLKKYYGSGIFGIGAHEVSDSELDKILKDVDPNQTGLMDEHTSDMVALKRLRIQKQLLDNGSSDYDKSNARLESQQASLMGNTKNPKGSIGKNKLDEELRLQEDKSRGNQDKIQGIFDSNAPYNGYADEVELSKAKIKEAEDNAAKKLAIIEKYHNSFYEDENKYLDLKQKASDEDIEISNTEKEKKEKIFEEVRRLYQANILEIDAYNRKIEELNSKLQSLQIKSITKGKQGEEDLKSAKSINPIFASIGVEDSNKSFKEQQEKEQRDIDEQTLIISNTQKKSGKFQEQADLSRQWLDINGKNITGSNDAEKSANDKTGQYKLNLVENEKSNEDLGNSNIELESQTSDRDDAVKQKQIELEKRHADAKKAIIKSSYDYSIQLINGQFDLQEKRIKAAQSNLQASSNFEMTLAGNNNAAKNKIATRTYEEGLALRRKEAETEKEQAIFSALINTYKGVGQALGSYPPPEDAIMAAIALGLGLDQVSQISNEPLPQYKTGRIGGKKEKARVGEEGFEIGESSSGKLRLLPNIVTELQEGESVHTHGQSTKFIKDLLKGTGVFIEKENHDRQDRLNIIKEGISKSDFKDAMVDAIKTMPIQERLVFPEPHVIKAYYEQRKNNGLAD